MSQTIVLCILDGVGIGSKSKENAVYEANTPHLDYLFENYPHSKLQASGEDVGLPHAQMGNSEVGHLNIGAGRVVHQSLSFINHAIEEGTFYTNPNLTQAMSSAKEKKKKLHLMGVLSDGGIHSHINHLKELLRMASMEELEEVYVHAFLDGRDTFIDSAAKFIKDLEEYMEEIDCGKIASISGRYYAMDRDNHFERNYETYKVMVLREGESFDNPLTYIKESYEQGIYDEFVKPAYNRNVEGQIEDEDSVIFYNFRPDRAIQLASLLTNPNYKKVFEKQPKNLNFVSMMFYDESVLGKVAFEREELKNVAGPYLASLGKKQLRIAETEKYAHVTFFMDGQVKYDGIEQPELEGCKRILVESPRVDTYDQQPEMSAYTITDKLLEELDKQYLDLVILNYANGDMVGHTGVLDKTIKAVETLDACVASVYQKLEEQNGILVITADHGNCEYMLDDNDNVSTTHTNNEVGFIITKKGLKLKNGRLSDIMPTIFELMGVEKPKEMDGKSLIIKGE